MHKALFVVLEVLLALSATVAIILIDAGAWSDAPGWVVIGGAGALGALAARDPIQRYRAHTKAELATKVDAALAAAAIGISDITKIPVDQIKLNCFVTPRLRLFVLPLWLRLWARTHIPLALWERLPYGPALQRLGEYRVRNVPSRAGIVWRPGKGAIGECWARRKDVAFDSYKHWGPLEQCSEDEWKDVPEEIKSGLTYDDFTRIRGKYGAVLVTPILGKPNDTKFRGCVTVDVPNEPLFQRLYRREVREQLGNAVAKICGFLR